jgi:hypothetical protein
MIILETSLIYITVNYVIEETKHMEKVAYETIGKSPCADVYDGEVELCKDYFRCQKQNLACTFFQRFVSYGSSKDIPLPENKNPSELDYIRIYGEEE